MFALPRFQVNLLLKKIHFFIRLFHLHQGFPFPRPLFASEGIFVRPFYNPARKAITKFLPNATSPELYGR